MKANKIYKLRITMDMSQAEFGAVMGRTQTCISLWESGKSYPQAPDLKKIMKFAKLFKVDISLEDIYG